MKNELVASIIIVMFLFHPQILRYMLSAFACQEIDSNEYWLISNLDILCWHGEHSFYTLYVAFPGLVLWGLFAPGFVLVFILKYRKYLKEADMLTRFGFLFLGYKSHLYYWEFVIIYRKIVIVMISVFLSTVSNAVQGQVAFLVLITAFYFHSVYMPFETEKLNKLEQMSILTSAITIYCGLLYLTGDMGEGMKIFLFTLILLSNAVFFITWLLGILEAYAILVSEKKP